MSREETGNVPRAPDRELIEGALRFIPMLELYYRRAPGEMPDELRRIFKHHRLTGRHGTVLAQLTIAEELRMGELSVRLGVGASTISELVGDLASVGMVVRRHDPDNRRRVLVSLAEDQREIMRAFMAKRSAPLVRVFASLSPEEARGFASGLEKWAHEVYAD